jgi:hypothetical protein
MATNLKLTVLLAAIIILIIVFALLRKGKLPVKYSLPWVLAAIILIIVALIPDFLKIFMNAMGFQTLSNLLIGILIFILLSICIFLTVIVSGQKESIKLLVQEVSLLKKHNEDENNAAKQ